MVYRWCELAEQHGLDMVVCVAAAQRRGILDADEAKRNGKDGDNIAPGFRISGLGQLIEAGIEADRLLGQFFELGDFLLRTIDLSELIGLDIVDDLGFVDRQRHAELIDHAD